MARPWPKRSGWPYVAKNERKSYNVGFYDHDKRERSRSFPSVRHAREWMDDYTTAERRGRDSLRRFLLDLDAKEANDAEARTITEIIELYLDLNAHPRNEGGLAPSTFQQYLSMANCHLLGKPRRKRNGEPLPPARYATAVASVPAVHFNGPSAPRAWREEMMRADVPRSSREHAWRVLSATLSWAARSPMVPEIQTNGCNLVNEDGASRRRSIRRGGTGYAPNGRRRGMLVPSWALSPQAVETIREEMLGQAGGRRDPILAHRDAVIVSLQYGLGARNQEIWGLRWMSLADDFVLVTEVLSHGQLDERGKTEHSAHRRTIVPSILREDLTKWRLVLRHWGHPARDVDFIVPGDLAGPRYGVREQRTGACDLTHNQAQSWSSRCLSQS